MGSLDEFTESLFSRPEAIVTCSQSVALLAYLNRYWEDRVPSGMSPGTWEWQYQATPREREHFSVRKRPGARIIDQFIVVKNFGWRNHAKNGNRFHLMLDPGVFNGQPVGNLMTWTTRLREFALDSQIDIRPTQGAMASQFLKDPRFYPDRRRKVPRRINDDVRPNLPGNHYKVYAEYLEEHQGAYYDQKNAHHYHTIHTPLPDANYTYAYGRFRARDRGNISWKSDVRMDAFLEGFSGMLYGVIQERNGKKKTGYFFSSDLDLMRSRKHKIVSLIAAWGGKQYDTGLPAYAKWATEQRERFPEFKGLLIAPYGALATTPHNMRVGFRRGKGKLQTFPVGHGLELPIHVSEVSRESEPTTNHVLQRALIEAATRTESLMFSDYMKAHTLAIYADAVILDDDTISEGALIPEPWHSKGPLTRLQFLSEQAFTSAELSKIPGGRPPKEAVLRRAGVRTPAPRRPIYEAGTGRRLGAKEICERGLQAALI